jgi:LMBR1 domain-containing protein 1
VILHVAVDIYIVSSNLNHDGSQSNPELTKNSSAGLQNFYYALYIALLAFAFLFVPFAYFWFEEDSEEDSTPSSSGNRRGSALEPLSPRSASGASSKRFCGALKYTSGFIVFFFVLLALGLVLKKGHQDDESDWRNRLSNDFTGAEAILSFCIGCLSCIGLMAYVVYAAYGLARMPLKLMAKAKAAKLKKASLPTSGPKASSRAEDVEVALLKNKENMEFLEAKYQSSSPSSPSNRAWSAEDMKKKNALRKEQRDLMQQRNASQRQGIAIQARAARNEKLTCWDKCWNGLSFRNMQA